MNLLRLMLLACVLLAQAWPAQALARTASSTPETPACTEGCCAWLVEEGMSLCGCDETPAPAPPASLPPLSGRDLVPQVVWVELRDEVLAVQSLPKQETDVAAAFRREDEEGTARPVRLPVLFCALLN